jgi:putative endonuclease
VWHVYIVKCADRTLYTGVAKNVEARIEQHNSGQGAKYTRTRRPVELVYRETAADRSTALRREHAIKRMRLDEKTELIRTSPEK